MKEDKRLLVYYKEHHVGTLALTGDRKDAFEYTDEWIENGFSISPFSLPLKKQVFLPAKPYFGGLFGVFADSLPDAWGNILLNRILRQNHINPDTITVLDRLAIVGDSGMGALTYRPEYPLHAEAGTADLDALMEQCQKILNTEYTEDTEKLDELYILGGTSGGARPKIMTDVDGEAWIIKFPSRFDGMSAGKMEYDYARCAVQCGIDMTETRLFPSEKCPGYFGIKRFDRCCGGKRIHMQTAAALLELDFNQPSLDYHSLMKLTKILTHDNVHDMENLYRRMCFNVFAHNRDDHAKNFSFLYDDTERMWRLSPAYDLTYSNTYYGEHTTTVDGNGVNPDKKELIAVGTVAGLSQKKCGVIADEIRECVDEMLGEYLR